MLEPLHSHDIMGGLSSVAHDEVPDDVVIRDIAHRDTFPTLVGFILHSWMPGITMIPRSVWHYGYRCRAHGVEDARSRRFRMRSESMYRIWTEYTNHIM